MRLVRMTGVVLCSIAVWAQTPKSVTPAGGYRIAGVVYDASSGQTLPGARISLGGTGGDQIPDRSVLTGPEGKFVFERLAADKYQVFGEAVGYPAQGFDQHEAPFFTGVVVGPNNSADHLVFRLQRGSSISGVVTDEFNDPVEHAQVMLFLRGMQDGKLSTHFAREIQTDDLGEYKFGSLMPGTYFVGVYGKPWYAHSTLELAAQTQASASRQVIDNMKRLDVAYPLTFYSGATDSNDATPITLHAGDRESADIGLHSVPTATLIVKSVTQKNGQVAFVRLSQQVFGDFDVPTAFEQRNRGEDMLFTGIAPGTYQAHITLPNTQGERVQEIEVSGDTVIDPDTISSAGSCSIKGLARVSGQATLPHDLVIFLRPEKVEAGPGTRIDDKTGEFSFEGLRPGTYDVSIANANGIYLLDMAASNAKVNGRKLTITGTATVELAVMLGKGLGEVQGTALRDGKGVGGTMILLTPVHGETSYELDRRDQSDSDGTFALHRIVPGKYYVLSIDGGWDLEWGKAEVLKPYRAKATTIDVAPNGKYDIKVQVQQK